MFHSKTVPSQLFFNKGSSNSYIRFVMTLIISPTLMSNVKSLFGWIFRNRAVFSYCGVLLTKKAIKEICFFQEIRNKLITDNVEKQPYIEQICNENTQHWRSKDKLLILRILNFPVVKKSHHVTFTLGIDFLVSSSGVSSGFDLANALPGFFFGFCWSSRSRSVS